MSHLHLGFTKVSFIQVSLLKFCMHLSFRGRNAVLADLNLHDLIAIES